MKPVIIKLYDLAYPSRKNQVLALPSMDKRSVRRLHDGKITTWTHEYRWQYMFWEATRIKKAFSDDNLPMTAIEK